MKFFYLLILSIFISFSASGQIEGVRWFDYMSFDPSCVNGDSLMVHPSNSDIEIDFTFSYSVIGNNIPPAEVIERNVVYNIVDENGTVLNSVAFNSHMMNQEVFTLDNSHFNGIDLSIPLFIDVQVCYRLVSNDNDYIHSVLFHSNNNLISQEIIKIEGDEFCCSINHAICINPCPDFTGTIKIIAFNKLKAMILGNPDHFNYSWTMVRNGIEIPIGGNTQILEVEPCIDARYNLEITHKETGCKYFATKPFNPPANCDPCLVAVPGGIQVFELINGDFNISWEPANGADYYGYKITINDPDCCTNGFPLQLYSGATTNTSVILPAEYLEGEGPTCFSVVIYSFCDGPGPASPSDKVCYIEGNLTNPGSDNSKVRSENDASFAIFPNPTDGPINISIKNVQSEDALISLYSTDGRLIFKSSIDLDKGDGTYRLDHLKLETGIYFVQLLTENQEITKKVLIQN